MSNIKADIKISTYVKFNFPRRRISYETATPKNFSSLPIPILIKIFDYINKNDLIKYVSLVCKHWRHAVMQPIFVKSLTMRGNEVPLPCAFDHIRKFRPIESLHFDNVPNPKALFMQVDKFGKHSLKRLAMINYNDMDIICIKFVIRLFPNLQAINLENSTINDTAPNYPLITCFIQLRGLNLSKIKNLTMKNILEIVLNCRYLEELNIGLLPPLVDLYDDDACLIISNIAPSLVTLSIDSRSLTSRTYERLVDCPRLKNLFLNYAVNLTGEFLLDFWKYMRNIEQLGFSHNCIITGNDVHELFTTGSDVFYKITYLDFTHCVLLGDNGVEAIAQCCKKLKTIYLKSCRSLTNIDMLCKNCKDLRVLNVAFCDQLKTSFRLPKKMEKFIVNPSEIFLQYIGKLRHRKDTNFYMALSEYSDEMERI